MDSARFIKKESLSKNGLHKMQAVFFVKTGGILSFLKTRIKLFFSLVKTIIKYVIIKSEEHFKL